MVRVVLVVGWNGWKKMVGEKGENHRLDALNRLFKKNKVLKEAGIRQIYYRYNDSYIQNKIDRCLIYKMKKTNALKV